MNPSNDYKAVSEMNHAFSEAQITVQSILAGLAPSIILEIAARYFLLKLIGRDLLR